MARLFPDDIPYLEETDKRKKKLFDTENPLELIADLLKIFEKYLDSIQIYNKVVQGTPIPHHRVLFFIERISKGLYAKWHMFFKHLLKYYSLNEVGDLLYQGFSYAGLKKEYLDVILQGGHYFLWPQGKTVVSPYHPLPAICPHE